MLPEVVLVERNRMSGDFDFLSLAATSETKFDIQERSLREDGLQTVTIIRP